MEVVYCVLIIVKEVKGFSRRVITFLIYVVLEKNKSVPAIKLRIQDTVHIL